MSCFDRTIATAPNGMCPMRTVEMKIHFIHAKTLCALLFFIVLSSLLVGCTLIQLRKITKIAKTSIVLVGTVSSMLPIDEMPVVVAAYSKKDGKRGVVHFVMLHEPGPYELMVPVGTHHIIAFGDKNKNLIYDYGEPAGQILTAEQVSSPTGGVAGYLDIVLSEHHRSKIDFPVGFHIQPKAYKKFHSTRAGAMEFFVRFRLDMESNLKRTKNSIAPARVP